MKHGLDCTQSHEEREVQTLVKRIEKQANQDATQRIARRQRSRNEENVRRLQEKGRELNLDPSFAAANESHFALFASIAAVPDPVPVCPRQRKPACSFGSGLRPASCEIRFARGTARLTTWCAVDHRVVDWASRSLPTGSSK